VSHQFIALAFKRSSVQAFKRSMMHTGTYDTPSAAPTSWSDSEEDIDDSSDDWWSSDEDEDEDEDPASYGVHSCLLPVCLETRY